MIDCVHFCPQHVNRTIVSVAVSETNKFLFAIACFTRNVRFSMPKSFRPNVYCDAFPFHFHAPKLPRSAGGAKKKNRRRQLNVKWSARNFIIVHLFVWCASEWRMSPSKFSTKMENKQMRHTEHCAEFTNTHTHTQLIPKWLKNRTTFVPTPLFNADHFDWAFFTRESNSKWCSQSDWICRSTNQNNVRETWITIKWPFLNY